MNRSQSNLLCYEVCKSLYSKLCLFLLVFLSSELQAAHIMRNRQVSDKQQDKSSEYQELLKICETLNLAEPGGEDAADVFSEIQNKVRLFNDAQGIFKSSVSVCVLF